MLRFAFADHHVYRPREIRALAAQALKHGHPAALLTTKKDVMNLPYNYAELIAPVELLWLEVETRIDNEDEFYAFIERAISTVRPRSSPEVLPRASTS